MSSDKIPQAALPDGPEAESGAAQSNAAPGAGLPVYFPDADEDLECTHCGGEGLCWDGADPLGSCPDEPHNCHACYGTGQRRHQWLF